MATMKCASAGDIFSSGRYYVLEAWAYKLSIGKSATILRKELRKTLNDAIRIKVRELGKKELQPGLHRVATLLQQLVLKSCFLPGKPKFEEIIPETADRCLLRYIFNPGHEDVMELDLEEAVKTIFRNFGRDLPSAAYMSLAEHFQEIVSISQNVIDELK